MDDLLIVGNDAKARSDLLDALRSEFKEVSVQSKDDMSFVGLEILTDKDKNVKVRQLGYIKDVLEHFKIAEGDFQDHPCSANIMDQPKAGDKSFDKSIFLSGVCRCTDPKESDWNSLSRIAKYYLVFKHGGGIKLSALVSCVIAI